MARRNRSKSKRRKRSNTKRSNRSNSKQSNRRNSKRSNRKRTNSKRRNSNRRNEMRKLIQKIPKKKLTKLIQGRVFGDDIKQQLSIVKEMPEKYFTMDELIKYSKEKKSRKKKIGGMRCVGEGCFHGEFATLDLYHPEWEKGVEEVGVADMRKVLPGPGPRQITNKIYENRVDPLSPALEPEPEQGSTSDEEDAF